MVENKISYDLKAPVLADRLVLQIAELVGQEFAPAGYRFDITLDAETASAGGSFRLFQPATLMISSDVIFHGVVGNSVCHTADDGKTRCEISLIPRLWQLKALRHRCIFRRHTVRQIVSRVLKESGFNGRDFRFELRRRYRSHPYCLQHSESDLDFILRLLKQENLSFFFEQGEEREILVITDDAEKYPRINRRGAILYYLNDSDLDQPEIKAARRDNSRHPPDADPLLPAFDMFPERLVRLNGEARLIIHDHRAAHGVLPDREILSARVCEEGEISRNIARILNAAEAQIEATEDNGLRISTGGSKLQIGPAGILLKSGGTKIMIGKEGAIEIRAAGDLILQGENLHAAGAGDLEVNAGRNLKILARQDLSQKAHNITSEAKVINRAKGLTVKSEAAALNEVKGALVKVN